MMSVLGPYGVVLEVPDLAAGIKFYSDAGLTSHVKDNVAGFQCPGQSRDCITLIGGAPRKRLHHLVLHADPRRFDEVRRAVPANGGQLIDPLPGSASNAVWLVDPHGLSVELREAAPELPLSSSDAFEVNAPGRLVRKGRRGQRAKSSIGPVQPLRLGHVMLFTPDVSRSVHFFTEVLGMGLADRAQNIVAFLCARQNSDHHVVAFAKSNSIGFHHASFQVASPDEVGVGGRRLIEKGYPGNWGFGRHTIGSNFFHYIQDPWGSWFEYYSDIDYIEEHSSWRPSNYAAEDSLDNWGPPLPKDFVHNYEASAGID
jgi:catechol 2,3-dioxygenase